jgi:hypothetical protein
MLLGESAEPLQIGKDRGRARDVERPVRFQEIALGVDIDENERTIEHDNHLRCERADAEPIGPIVTGVPSLPQDFRLDDEDAPGRDTLPASASILNPRSSL